MIKMCVKCENEFECTEKYKSDYCKKCLPTTYKKEVKCIKCGDIRLVSKYRKNTDICIKCNNIGRKHTEETNRKNSERNRGEKNAMYGKTHTDESKSKLSKKQKERVRSKDEIELATLNLRKNANIISPIQIWTEKYGIDVALEKEMERKRKMSISLKGENNPMYGKPSPTGSGNGWSGWYKKHYFRSLLELSFLKYCYDNNIQFESGEQKKYSIPYIIDGVKRNYFCDYFLVESNTFIEIKPKALLNNRDNKPKFDAAYKILGDRFIIKTEYDIKKLTDYEILDMYNNGEIKWLDRYQKKFEERYLNVTIDNN